MSVTFHLYKPVPVKCIPGTYYTVTNEEWEDIEKEFNKGHPDFNETSQKMFDELYDNKWEDGKNHEMYYIPVNKSDSKRQRRAYNRIRKKLELLGCNILQTKRGINFRYIAMDEVMYRQGWFLKSRFFKKPYTENVCITKEEMERFFKKYIDFKGKDKRGRECIQAFRDAWEDGMIFVCRW